MSKIMKKSISQLKTSSDMLPKEGYNYEFNTKKVYQVVYRPSTKEWIWEEAGDDPNISMSVGPTTSKS